MARRGSWASYLIWGCIAVCAVLASAVTIALVVGNHRGIQFAGWPKKPAAAAAERAARTAPVAPAAAPGSGSELAAIPVPEAKDREIARLNDALRALASERDRLDERLEKLEQSLGDITASVGRQPPAVESARAAPSSPDRIESAAAPAEPQRPPQRIAAAPSQPLAPFRTGVPPSGALSAPGGEAFLPYVNARPMVTPPTATQAPMQIHAIPLSPEAAPTRSAAPGAIRTDFAVDLGTEPNVAALRARWDTLRGTHPAVLGSLRPLVAVREGSRAGSVELRLLAGPLRDAGDAARTCASLQTKGVTCTTGVFDGQRLALH